MWEQSTFWPEEHLANLSPLQENERDWMTRRLAADGPRYRALGNSMAVPVMRWIEERIAAIHEIVSRGMP